MLVLEGDLCDSRNYSAEQLRARVESFAEMLKMAKAAKGLNISPDRSGTRHLLIYTVTSGLERFIIFEVVTGSLALARAEPSFYP